MDYVEGVVKQYQRDYKRSLKSGKTRRYTTKQYTITLPGKTALVAVKEDKNGL